MKIALYSDVHWMTTSSIISGRGSKYSLKLENLIQSVNWAEKEAVNQGCSEIICLGDFFDRSNITGEEITSLKDVEWANIPHSFLVGNHEASTKDLRYNTTNVLKNLGFNVIEKPSLRMIGDLAVINIPYLQDDIRKSINEYRKDFNVANGRCVVLSHNDVKGIQMGFFLSKEGIDIDDIRKNCDLFLNGHLHNGSKFSDNGINLGNLTGKTFEEDGFKYKHCLYVLDTDTLGITAIENPFAYNFYKLSIDSEAELTSDKIHQLKNAVVVIKCEESLKSSVDSVLTESENIKVSKVVVYRKLADLTEDVTTILNNEDHLKQFGIFAVNQYGADPILMEEIDHIIGGN